MKDTAAILQGVKELKDRSDYKKPVAFGLGLRKSREEVTMEVYYPKINYGVANKVSDVIRSTSGHQAQDNGYVTLTPSQLKAILICLAEKPLTEPLLSNIHCITQLSEPPTAQNSYHSLDVICYFLYEKDSAVETPEEGYFKTQCMSQLLAKPHVLNCSGIFGKMNNVAWSNKGPILPQDLPSEKIKWSLQGEELVVSHVDKFPYMVNFHVPEGVRIVMGSKVRLGAHLSPGTTVMPAGFVNFNAGTLGKAMIEGRVSAGVVIGDKTDIGGGASIMGTLSGGNKHVISIGEQCLLGANAGTGISLGDGCTVAAGVYVTAASKIALYDKNKHPINLEGQRVQEGENVVKGESLSGQTFLLIYQDSESGRLVARPNTRVIELNESLHS